MTLRFHRGFSAFLLVVVLLLAGYHTFGNRQANGPNQPAIIATFDLERTFNALDLKKSAFDELKKLGETLEAKRQEMATSLKQMYADLEDHVPGSAKYRELEEKLLEKENEFRATAEFNKMKLDIERARNVKKVYLEIKKVVESMATENKWAVVLVDDSIAEIPPGSEEEITRQISARRIVYSSPDVDITDMLIARMNQEFK